MTRPHTLPRRLRLNFFLLLFFVSSLPAAVVSEATPEYARQTGLSCGGCHADPAGGGRLTQAGEAFRDDLKIKGLYRSLSPAQKVVRFVVGYVHMLTAIAWFGTILYVHIVLKPAYAARGLPRGELLLGWAGIGVMAVTGTLLSISRAPSWRMLFHTRFGILLTVKVGLFLVMVTTAFLVTFVIGPRLRRKIAAVASGRRDLTPEELSSCDGREGRPAYIAYAGMIYDVTASRFWRNGAHMKKHAAGTDLSDVLKTAPHGEERLLGMPAVGRLIEPQQRSEPLPVRVFYAFAYMNLALVFLIVFVISLWRWW